ncbi:MAG: AMP-binding protein [Anaerolineae bacterium]|nr:AMP-binding protein [Anaerolineae bacterium]
MFLGAILTRHAQYRPYHLAVVFNERRLTYRDFNARVNRLANALLAEGIGRGDKIATLLPNCLELLELYWAVAKIGAVVVPLSPLLRGKGLSTLLDDSDSVMVITDSGFMEHLTAALEISARRAVREVLVIDAPVPAGCRSYHALVSAAADHEPVDADGTPIAPAPEDVYNIIYSSGTTGLPKGIVHTHQIRALYCLMFSQSYRITPESVVLHAGSIIFNGAFLTLMPAFFNGATYILHDHFDAGQVIETIAREKVTHVKMVPSQIIALLHHPDFTLERLASLQMLGSVGAPLHREHKDALAKVLPGRFCELYGLTEGFVTVLDPHDFPAKPESVGAPLPFEEMRIVDEDGRDVPAGTVGEIVGRGPILMPGYYKRPDLTAQAIRDGWLFTGDLGYVDEDGFLFLVDRKKDMIISGGVNVYPRDIEEIIVQHPLVKEAAVFGAPSEKWGETPVAAVILKEAGSISADALRDWINEHVEARFQRVSAVLLKEEFPRSAAGKTLKRLMRDEFWQGRDARI